MEPTVMLETSEPQLQTGMADQSEPFEKMV